MATWINGSSRKDEACSTLNSPAQSINELRQGFLQLSFAIFRLARRAIHTAVSFLNSLFCISLGGPLMKVHLALATLFLTHAVWNHSAFAVVDFESAPGGGPPADDAAITGPYTDSGVQITFGFDQDSNGSVETPAIFEQAGTFQGEGMNIGFVGSDDGITTVADTADTGFGGQLGNWFLRGSTFGTPFGRFVIQYSSSFLVTAAGGEIWDIDGQVPLGTLTEQYKVEAFDSANNSLAVQLSPVGVLTSTIAPLDGRPWVFSFSGLTAGIDHIDITFVGTKPSGIGLAFNNFYPTTAPVPEPTGLLILASGGCGIVLRRVPRSA
jgi:hypothetical protein